MGPRLFRRGNLGSPPGPKAPHGASMGPRLFRRGNPAITSLLVGLAVASMGPRLFRRGNVLVRAQRPHGDHRASMGPRLFRRGNVKKLERLSSHALLLHWGHVFSDVELSHFALSLSRAVWGFNGATSFQTWKFLHHIQTM